MHPGWADTPGVASSHARLPPRHRPLLRTEAQGADTVVWLQAAAEPGHSTGVFWHDRAPRPTHYLPRGGESPAGPRGAVDALRGRDGPVSELPTTDLEAPRPRRGAHRGAGGGPVLTPERRALQDTARAFAMEEVLPVADELDPRREDIPRSLLDRMGELGYFGILVDAEHGGLGLGVVEYCLVSEELARAWMSVGSIIARGNGTGCASPDPERRAELLRASAAGRWIGAIAFSEPHAGSDLAGVECTARRDGDGWVVDGTKRWVGHARSADFLHLLARTRAAARGREPLRRPRALPRAQGARELPRRRHRHAHRQDRLLRADDLGAAARRPAPAGRRAAGHRPGRGPGLQGQPRAGWAPRGCRPRRVPWGWRAAPSRTPWPTAGAASSSATRSPTSRRCGTSSPTWPRPSTPRGTLWWHAAWLLDEGAPGGDVAASSAKLFASETAERVTSDALQIFGGNGYTTEHSVERYWRDARLTTIFEGTSEIQRKIISDALLKP